MGAKWFNVGFIVIFLISMGILFYFFRGSDKEIGAGFWAALIFLFLLFGIIIVSLYVKYMRNRKDGEKERNADY